MGRLVYCLLDLLLTAVAPAHGPALVRAREAVEGVRGAHSTGESTHSVVETAEGRVAAAWQVVQVRVFLYHGWNVVAEFDAASPATGSPRQLVQSYLWGTDLSGTPQGAGGVGGLLVLTDHRSGGTGSHGYAYDGNGNVLALVALNTGTISARYDYDPFGQPLGSSGPASRLNPYRFSTKYTDPFTHLAYYGYRFYDPAAGRWLSRDPIGETGGLNLYGFVGNKGVNCFDLLGLSELSETQYRAKAGTLIDSGVLDPDKIFQGLIEYYFHHDKDSDLFWDCQDDMEEIFDALGDVLATNFKGQPPGSPSESQDAKRFRKVRNWVESMSYDMKSQPMKLVKASQLTNPNKKFENRMDAVMHFYAGGAVGVNAGETLADIISWGVEVTDEVKNWFGNSGGPYDTTDLTWGIRGSELQNAFDVGECKCRKLARKFQNGTFTASQWLGWYGKPANILY